MQISLITTTINIPELLDDYAKDLSESSYKTNIIVAGDKKTPNAAKILCQDIEEKYSISVDYLDIDDQNLFLKDFPELEEYLPWNCIQRRNLAILKAYLNGSDIIITIDDDNFLTHTNYLKGHDQVGSITEFDTYKSPTGWLNICDYLEDRNNREFFARGYPWLERINKVQDISKSQEKSRIVVNAGFWLGDPDIDAVTRLAAPIDVTGYKLNSNFCLAKDTWAPFNSQNTALHRSIIPAYFLVANIGRYDDIWASYIVKKIADHLNEYISFGFPLVKQNRNEHNLWIDAEQERLGTELSDKFCNWLREIKLIKQSYADCIVELILALEQEIQKADINDEQREYCNSFIKGYKVWIKTFSRISNK